MGLRVIIFDPLGEYLQREMELGVYVGAGVPALIYLLHRIPPVEASYWTKMGVELTNTISVD